MRNLPDEELFSKLKERLQNFKEQPDEDVWSFISSSLPKEEPRWIRTTERSAWVLAFLLIGATWMMPRYYPELPRIRAAAHYDTTPEGDTHSGGSALSQAPATSTIRTLHPPLAAVEAAPSVVTSPRHHPNKDMKGIVESIERHPRTINGSDAREIPRSGVALTTSQLYVTNPQPSEHQFALTTVDSAGRTSAASTTMIKADSAAQVATVVTKPARKRQIRWRTYGMLTPSLTFLHVNPSTTDDVTFGRLNSPAILSKQRLALSFEGGVEVSIGRKLVAFAGLTYYHQAMEFSLEQFEDGTGSFSTNHTLDFSFAPNSSTATINYELQNIGATAGIMYVLSQGELVHHLGASLQYEYGLLRPSTESDKSTAKNFLNYRIQYRAAYHLNKRTSLFVQPSFTSALLSDDLLNGALRVKQSRAGISIGILHQFRIRR